MAYLTLRNCQDLLLLALQNEGLHFDRAALAVVRAQSRYRCDGTAGRAAPHGAGATEQAGLQHRMRLRQLARSTAPPLVAAIARRCCVPPQAGPLVKPEDARPSFGYGRHAGAVRAALASDTARVNGPGCLHESLFGVARVWAKADATRPTAVWALPTVFDSVGAVEGGLRAAAAAVETLVSCNVVIANTAGSGRVDIG